MTSHASASPRRRWAFWLLAGIAVFYLLTEHQAHLIGGPVWLPLLLLLAACLLIHVFGHHGHGGHGGHRPARAPDAAPPPATGEDGDGSQARPRAPHAHRGDQP